METIQWQGKTIHKWTLGPSLFTACIEDGARLMNWNISLSDGTFTSLLHWPEDADLKKIAKVRGGNPILFPFAGPAYENEEEGFWKDGRDFRRAYPQHGFARQGKFALKDVHHAGFSAVFEPGAEAKENYPYAYEFTVTYRFEKLAFFVDLALRNLDREPIPWAAGHHFYFAMPWSPQKNRSDYEVVIPHRKAARLNPVNGRRDPLKSLGKVVSLDHPELFNRIHSPMKENTVLLREKGEQDALRIRFNDDADMRKKGAVVTWSEDPHSPYYCVEPWMGVPNGWAEPETLHFVPPGKTQTFYTEVRYLPAIS